MMQFIKMCLAVMLGCFTYNLVKASVEVFGGYCPHPHDATQPIDTHGNVLHPCTRRRRS